MGVSGQREVLALQPRTPNAITTPAATTIRGKDTSDRSAPPARSPHGLQRPHGSVVQDMLRDPHPQPDAAGQHLGALSLSLPAARGPGLLPFSVFSPSRVCAFEALPPAACFLSSPSPLLALLLEMQGPLPLARRDQARGLATTPAARLAARPTSRAAWPERWRETGGDLALPGLRARVCGAGTAGREWTLAGGAGGLGCMRSTLDG